MESENCTDGDGRVYDALLCPLTRFPVPEVKPRSRATSLTELDLTAGPTGWQAGRVWEGVAGRGNILWISIVKPVFVECIR